MSDLFDSKKRLRFRSLWLFEIVIMGFIAFGPLITIFWMSDYHFDKTLDQSFLRKISGEADHVKSKVDQYLQDRKAVVSLLINSFRYEELADQQ